MNPLDELKKLLGNTELNQITLTEVEAEERIEKENPELFERWQKAMAQKKGSSLVIVKNSASDDAAIVEYEELKKKYIAEAADKEKYMESVDFYWDSLKADAKRALTEKFISQKEYDYFCEHCKDTDDARVQSVITALDTMDKFDKEYQHDHVEDIKPEKDGHGQMRPTIRRKNV